MPRRRIGLDFGFLAAACIQSFLTGEPADLPPVPAGEVAHGPDPASYRVYPNLFVGPRALDRPIRHVALAAALYTDRNGADHVAGEGVYNGGKSYPSPHMVLCENGLRPITHSNCCCETAPPPGPHADERHSPALELAEEWCRSARDNPSRPETAAGNVPPLAACR